MTVYSSFTSLSPSQLVNVIGVSGIPNDVTNFTVISSSVGGIAAWDASTELDVRVGGYIEIRWTGDLLETSAGNAIVVYSGAGTLTGAIIPLQTGSYFASWVDIAGNRSANPTRWSMTAADVISYTLVDSLAEDPTFGGIKTNLEVVSNSLRLGGLTAWDSVPGNIDDWIFLDDTTGYYTDGSYDWSTYIDAVSIGSYKLDITTNISTINTSDTIDSRSGNIDDYGNWDGDIIGFTNAITYYTSTSDDPSGSPTWSSWAPIVTGLVYGRAFKFKTDLSTSDSSVIISVTALSATLRTP
jgi:hypothetical protein